MLLALILLSLFFTMLLFPETVFQGACDGLLLWYQILIPTLFPYLIVTGLLLKTDGAAVVSRLLFRPFHLLFGTSFYGSFAVLSGFLCGYPMGAKIIADLLLQGKISLEEIARIRKKYEHNFNSDRDNFNKFKKEVMKKIKPEH